MREDTTNCIADLRRKGFRTATPESWDERAQIVNVLVSDAERLMRVLHEKHRVVINVKDIALRL